MEDVLTAEPIVTPSQAAPVESMPAATPAATLEVTPAAAPVTESKPTGEEKPPEITRGKSATQHLAEVLKHKNVLGEKKETPAEVKPATEVETKAEEKTPEQIAAEAKAAEDAEKAKTEQKVEETPFDKSGPLPAEKLAAALAEDKELSAALEGKVIKLDDGREVNLKDAIFESSRMAAQAQPMLELFPTIEAAQEADQGAKIFFDLDTKFPSIKDSTSYDRFMSETLVPLSFVLDDKGQPIPDPQNPGMYKTDGSIQRFVKFTSDVEFDQIGKIADIMAKQGNEASKAYAEDLAAAVKFVNDFRNNGYRISGTPSAEKPTIPPEVQAELDLGRARERELNEREIAQEKQQHETFEEKITDSTFQQVTPLIEKVVGSSSLSDYEKKTVVEHVWQDIADKLESNPTFKRGIEQMMSRRELSDAVQQRRVAHNVSYMKSILTVILDKRLQEAGGKRLAAKAEVDNKRATQTEQSRMEPKSGAVTPAGQPAALDGDQLHKKAIENARAKNGGREPSPGQILQETVALKKVLVSA